MDIACTTNGAVVKDAACDCRYQLCTKPIILMAKSFYNFNRVSGLENLRCPDGRRFLETKKWNFQGLNALKPLAFRRDGLRAVSFESQIPETALRPSLR